MCILGKLNFQNLSVVVVVVVVVGGGMGMPPDPPSVLAPVGARS